MTVYNLKTYQNIQALKYAIESYKLDMMELLKEHPVIEPGHPEWEWFSFMVYTIKSLSLEIERLKHGTERSV